MNKLTMETLEDYIQETYRDFQSDQGMFMKLVEEVGEIAELMNIRDGRKSGDADIKEDLAKELADVIHYTVAIAVINHIDLCKAIIDKDTKAATKYNHPINLKAFMEK